MTDIGTTARKMGRRTTGVAIAPPTSFGWDSLSPEGRVRVLAKYAAGLARYEAGEVNYPCGSSARTVRKWHRQLSEYIAVND